MKKELNKLEQKDKREKNSFLQSFFKPKPRKMDETSQSHDMSVSDVNTEN